MELLNGVSTPSGRVRTFLEEPHKGTTPHSCTLIVYKNDLYDLLQFCSKSLRWGAGVKVILDEYRDRTPLDMNYLAHAQSHGRGFRRFFAPSCRMLPHWVELDDSAPKEVSS